MIIIPTEILFQTWSGGSGYGDPEKLIGYCINSPLEVLERVYTTHVIHKYRGIYRPVDWSYPNNVLGLVLNTGIAPSGTVIVGNVNDLDLSRAIAELKSPRTEQTYREALIAAIESCFDNPVTRTNYLDTRDQKRDKDLERRIQLLLEVAHVTLRIKEPTVEDLKLILRGNKSL